MHRLDRSLFDRPRPFESIEDAATDEVLQFHLPSLTSFVDDGARESQFFIQLEPVKLTIGEDIFSYTTNELRRIAGELILAADRVDLRQSGRGGL